MCPALWNHQADALLLFGNKETLFIQVLARQLHGFRSILDADRPLVKRLTELAQAMLTAFNTDIGSMMRDMEHVKEQSLTTA